MALKEYKLGTTFPGVIGRTAEVSKPAWPAAFSASETFDVGVDLGSPVSLVYAERRPFPFSGEIRQGQVELK